MPEYKQACLLAFTETWLDNHVQYSNWLIDGFANQLYLSEINVSPGRTMEDGYVFTLTRDGATSLLIATLCTPEIELLSVSLCPFYLPRKFPHFFSTFVYILPSANPARATELISRHINKLDSVSLDVPKFVLGGFNHCRVNSILKSFHQYVTCPTPRKRTIDLCYSSVPAAYSIVLTPTCSADNNGVQDGLKDLSGRWKSWQAGVPMVFCIAGLL